ncbi:DUF5994 family protein [Streptomyces sp. BH055]|uniref:DUF5994 family protein n=1 Tax=Streptomyces sp. BH055 TaxID=3401173 RepID=UPI003BB6877A
MSAPTAHRSTADPARARTPLPARLALRPPTFPAGPVCGAWWPRTDDLAGELAALTDAFAASHGRVTRIASHRGSWPNEPRTIPVRGYTVTASWYLSGLDPYTMRLFSFGRGRWDLFVVPPDNEDAAALRLMKAAADPALCLTGAALMAAEAVHAG